MPECPECGEDAVKSFQTQYGLKVQCESCNHLLKDVDAYAGVMIWSHKTAPELEIHANKESAQLISSASRKSSPQGNPRVVQHVGEMARRRGTTARAAPDFSTGSFVTGRTVPKMRPPDEVRAFLRGLDVPELKLLRSPVPGSQTVTEVSLASLRDLEPVIRSSSAQTAGELVDEVRAALRCSKKQAIWLIALRRRVSPKRGARRLRILRKGSHHYTPDMKFIG